MMEFLTSGDIARHLDAEGYDVGLGDVSYILRRLKARPLAVAGITRLFPTSALAHVREFLDAKHTRRKETVSA